MLKLYSKILLIFSFLNVNSILIQASSQAQHTSVSYQDSETDQILFRCLQSLDPQNSDLLALIRDNFDTVFASMQEDYKQALENKILAIKATIIAYAKTQQEQ